MRGRNPIGSSEQMSGNHMAGPLAHLSLLRLKGVYGLGGQSREEDRLPLQLAVVCDRVWEVFLLSSLWLVSSLPVSKSCSAS